MATIVKSLRAEFIKIKYPPIFWLSAVVIFAVLLIIFSAHFIDVNSVATLGGNPWRKVLVATQGIFSVFMIIPYIVLLVSAAIFVEHQSNTWKYQYTSPSPRYVVHLLKMMTIMLMLILSMLVLSVGLILIGYLLDQFLPEMEFAYYEVPYFDILKSLGHTFLAILGVLGIQYFLSMRFKGFLLPASLGIVAFIVGIIMGSTNNPLALYYPYSYPTIVKDVGMFNTDKVGVMSHGVFNNVEIYSLLIFVIFFVATCVLESRRNIT